MTNDHLLQARQSGNVLFIILIVIVLSGLLVVAMQSTSQTGNENIDKETLAIRASSVKQYAGELENAVRFVLENGASETQIRFAHPDNHSDYGTITTTPEFQVFSRDGGGATFKAPPSGINDGSAWEFYGNTHLPDVGSGKAELIAVLPNVTENFCALINSQNGYDPLVQPVDDTACLYDGATSRFDATTQFADTPNTTDESTFSVKPAVEACVKCGASYHFYHVLMSR